MNKTVTIKLPPALAFDENAIQKQLQRYGFNISHHDYAVRRRSIDARRKIVYVMQVEIGEKGKVSTALPQPQYAVTTEHKVAIIGAGSAGLFAALKLLEHGIKPVVFERGKNVRDRRRDLAKLTREHIVNPESNYCFGEGGAGTFSDGKLYTRSSKRGSVKDILARLVNHGADPSIMIDAHPHIGTNKLPRIISAMKDQIRDAGGEVHFSAKLTDIKIVDGQIKGITINNDDHRDFDNVILATGHSARDIYFLLDKIGVRLEKKGFAVGVRVEHDQKLIDKIQYKMPARGEHLPAAAYSLVSQVEGRGVYSFCMCPGGVIAPCATDKEEVVTNGWSPSRRNNPHANSGIVVSVEEDDLAPFEKHGALAGLYFQKSLEKKAWELAGKTQTAPAQRLVDFLKRKKSSSLPDCSYIPGITSVNLHEVFPKSIAERLVGGFRSFGDKMKGYIHPDAVLVGVETRSSAPLRIPRDKVTLEHDEAAGLYPCAEGAGYAGGIVSAAIDGENCARAIASKLGVQSI